MLSCLRGKKPFKRRHLQRCHIIYPQIVSGDIYREVVVLQTSGIHFVRFTSYYAEAGMYIIQNCKMENSTYIKSNPSALDCIERRIISAILKLIHNQG